MYVYLCVCVMRARFVHPLCLYAIYMRFRIFVVSSVTPKFNALCCFYSVVEASLPYRCSIIITIEK